MSFIGKTVKYTAIGFMGLVAVGVVGQMLETPEDKAAREAKAQQELAERVESCIAEVGKKNCTDRGFKTDEYYASQKARLEKEKAEREARLEKEEAKRKALAQAENKRKGFHCLSSWDGSHSAVKRAVENSMRNPDSFDHVETRITPVKDGQHVLTMKYRGQNGFGGMNLESVIAKIDNKTCKALSLARL